MTSRSVSRNLKHVGPRKSNLPHRTLRITSIPPGTDQTELSRCLDELPSRHRRKGTDESNIRGLTLAAAGRSQIATVAFHEEPRCVAECAADNVVSIVLKINGGTCHAKVDCDFLGITPLYSVGDSAFIDIIAVTGLAGHPFGSWRSSQTDTMWLKDLLPVDIPDSRILTYGYDSRVENSIDDSSISGYAMQLLEELSYFRRNKSTKRRPMIFIAHSLGGLVVKAALMTAAQSNHKAHNFIWQHTVGAFFFGVPNMGLNHENLLSVVENQRNCRLVRDLMQGSEVLQLLNQNFTSVWRGKPSEFSAVSFYETKDTPSVIEIAGKLQRNGPVVRMVSRESATLTSSNPSDHIPITGNHSTIVKFISHDDPGYRTVSNRLKDCIQSTREFLAKRSLTEANETLEPLNSLYDVPFDLTGVPVTKTFIGRREEIQRLKGLLPSSERGRRKVFVLCGLGGMGKTQLALEFARKHQNRFSAVFWINGRTRDAVIRSLSAIAERLVSLKILSLDGEDANDSKKQQRQADAFLEWLALKGNHKWLMIYDNVDKDTMMDDTDDADDGNADDGAYPVETFFPKADQGAIIVTTRLQRLQELGEDISLARMDPQDALQLLADNAGLAALQDTKDKFSSDAQKLSANLAGLPLAIVLAGSYIRQTRISVGQYLQLYTESWRDLQNTTRSSRSYANGTIQTTWVISYKEVEKRDSVSASLLRLLACFADRDIWYGLLKHGSSVDNAPEWFSAVASSKLGFISAIRVLLDYSMVDSEGANTYSIHPVVQQWCREYLNHDNDERIRLVLMLFSATISSIRAARYIILRRRLLPHIKYVSEIVQSDQFWTAQSHSAGTDREKIFDAVSNLGVIFSMTGKGTESAAIYNRVLVEKEKELGPNHMMTLCTVKTLSTVYAHHGNVVKAREMCERAVRGYTQVVESDFVAGVAKAEKRARRYVREGRLAEASDVTQRARAAYRDGMRALAATMMTVYSNVGSILIQLNMLNDAEVLFKFVLARQEETLGSDDHSTLETVARLGSVYHAQGRFVEAESMYLRILAAKENALGLEDVSTLNSVVDLAKLYMDQEKMAEAESMFQRAMTGFTKILKEDSIMLLKPLVGFAMLRAKQGRVVEAEALYKRALAVAKEVDNSVAQVLTELLDMLHKDPAPNSEPVIGSREPTGQT